MLRRSLACLLAVPLALTACTADESQPPDREMVAVLAAQEDLTRGAVATDAVRDGLVEGCPDCEVVTRDAGGDADVQAAQLEQVLADGADAVVLDPVDVEAADSLVADSDVPVVAVDRPLPSAQAHVGTDREATGDAMAEALVGVTGPRPRVVVAAGPEGSTSRLLTDEVLRALGGRATVVGSLPSPRAAARAARAHGADAVLTGDDESAAAVSEALGRVDRRPFVVGYGGDLGAVRRLVLGTQAVTVHAPWVEEGETAARLALELMGVEVATPSGAPTSSDRDGVRTVLLAPVVVTLPTLTDTVVRKGIFTTEDICAGEVATRCTQVGIR